MRESHFDGLRAYADDAARQPAFAVIQRRAGRVRRVRRVRAVAPAAVAVAIALFAINLNPDAGSPEVAFPTPSSSVYPDTGWPRITDVTATGSADLYAIYERCRDCGPQLYASHDAGATWQRRSVPPVPADAAWAQIESLGPDTLVWRYGRTLRLQDVFPSSATPAQAVAKAAAAAASPSATERWTTIDGGRTWRPAVVDAKPVPAAPPGTRLISCDLLGQPSPCRIYAVDPASGRFAPLAHQPTGITFGQLGTGMALVPLGAKAWVTGLDPTTHKPAVASSSDAGRTWHTHVFTPAVTDETGINSSGMHFAQVAAGTDGTAYALINRDDNLQDAYRTTDGGATWRPVPGGALADADVGGMVTADGAHVVKLLSGPEFLASRDGGRYQPVTLPGYPGDLRLLTQQAAGRYMEFTDSNLYISDDGWTWRRVDVP
jgi:hypothetical protein